MTNPTPNRPLWEEMMYAYRRSSAPFGEKWAHYHGYAAELRAIAKEVELGFATYSINGDPVLEVVSWLYREADRAEAGE
jgi:hypothetical protein